MALLSAISCIVFSTQAPAQKVTFGAITGAQLTEDFRSLACPDLGVSPQDLVPRCPRIFGASFTTADSSQRFIIGPKVNVRFSRSFSLEVDALRREIRTEGSWTSLTCLPPDCSTLFSFTQPYGGTEFTWEFPVLGRYQMSGRKLKPFVEGGPSFRPAENREQFGVTVGAGVERRLQMLRVSPAVRYTYWGYTGGRYPALNQNQFQFVLGIDGPESTDAISAGGHEVSLRVVAGLALTDGLQTRSDSFTDALEIDPATGVLVPVNGTEVQNSNRTSPVIGVVTEIALPKRLSMEVGAFYRPLNAEDISVFSNGVTRKTRFTVLTWEFPILAKYRLPILKTNPFVELGPSFRASGNLNGAKPSRYGVTSGLGMDLPWGGMAISPTLRFTHWTADSKTFGMATHPNQVELVFGVRF